MREHSNFLPPRGALAEEYHEELIALRRHFHAHPELSFEEQGTAAFVQTYLRKLGLEPEHIGRNGIVACVCAEGAQRTVAIRAEMDALAVEEQNDVPWKSQNAGVMHACGHDAILAVALVLAKLCVKYRAALPVNVKFLFQPAEENGLGTHVMLDAGVMRGVDDFIMFHFANDAPSGVELHRGASSAVIGSFELQIKGRASHWSALSRGVDAIRAAGKVLQAVEELNQSGFTSLPFILGVGMISGGTTRNAMAETVRMEGTIRACTEEDYFHLRALFQEKLEKIQADCGVTMEIYLENVPTPPIINDDRLVDLGLQVGRELWQEDCRLVDTHYLSGDSAAYYFHHARGLFAVFTAARRGEKNYPLHNGKFDLDEAVMGKAAEFLLSYLMALSDI